ncbi:class I SAM-dependent methyltransferase [Prochlorothrix hollandica]|uniref:class I SAM-dependent methyltransferase n=1 Tax=Prochlorothrix hollandica TaxID=1223 RepID=UPI00034593AB|nr:class I SAM-dependent methyltransferase [Prochlorothrix hollandica]
MQAKTLIHTVKYFLGIDSADTQTSLNERDALKHLAKNASKVLEIGVFEGHSTKLLAESMSSSGILYAIDPFFAGRLGISYGELISRSQISKACQQNKGVRVKILKDLSHIVAQKNTDLCDLDLIFIDGDHSLEGITRDWQDWSERVKKGGVIALHDTKVPAYNPNVANLGSFQYFESHIKHDQGYELLEQIDSLSVLQRK